MSRRFGILRDISLVLALIGFFICGLNIAVESIRSMEGERNKPEKPFKPTEDKMLIELAEYLKENPGK